MFRTRNRLLRAVELTKGGMTLADSLKTIKTEEREKGKKKAKPVEQVSTIDPKDFEIAVGGLVKLGIGRNEAKECIKLADEQNPNASLSQLIQAAINLWAARRS